MTALTVHWKILECAGDFGTSGRAFLVGGSTFAWWKSQGFSTQIGQMARDSNQTTNLGRRTSQTCMSCWFLGMKQNMGLDSSPESDLFSWKRKHQRQISLEGLLGRTKPNHLEPSQDVKNGLCFKVLDRPCNNGPWIGRFGTAIGNIWELRPAAEAPARTASRRKLRFGVPTKKNNSILALLA